MSRTVRRVAAAALLSSVPVLAAQPAIATQQAAVTAGSATTVIILGVPRVSLPELTANPTVRALIGSADEGGASLMVSSNGDPIEATVAAVYPPGAPIVGIRLRSSGELAPILAELLDEISDAPTALVLIYGTDPPGDPRWLGSVAMAVGDIDRMREALSGTDQMPAPEDTLTSNSTRRPGVVTAEDVATTAVAASPAADTARDAGGSLIRIVDAPPPVGLYERYLDQRRLVVPIGIVTGLYAFAAGLLGLVLVLGRVGSSRLRAFSAWAAIAVVPLTAGLMLVGHLDRLTYATVLAFLAAVAVLTLLGMALVQRASGSLAAIAALGAGLLVMFAVEAALGWTATLTPLLGGAQLDGGRFFGLPNVQIGLLMGASLYVAQRLRSSSAGVVLILAAALFAGLPWTGSNIGAAVTIAAAAGIWWGLRADGSRLRPITILRVLATATGTAAVVGVAHRYLTDAPTHVSRFASDPGGPAGIWDRFVDRLGVGADLIARNPFGLIPVVGILATLWLVLRPPAGLRPSLSAHPAWRDALVTILLGSVVAYVANDSGAAAIGLGFGTALGGLLYVSLTHAPAKMEAP